MHVLENISYLYAEFILQGETDMNKADHYLFYPIVIIGAGPAGSACGIRLAKNGIDCCIIEKTAFPRVKLCAGVLTAKSRHLLASLLGADDYARLMEASLVARESRLRLWHRQECFVDCDFTRADMLPPKLQDTDCRIHLVDRPLFDQFLAKEFSRLGGQLIEGDGCEDIDFTNKTITLRSGCRIGYNFLVAADGAVSHTEHLLHRYDPSFQRKDINSEAFEVNVSRADAPIDGVNIYFGFVPKTYAWAFSKGSKECLGFCKLRGEHFEGNQAMDDFSSVIGLRNQEQYPLHAAMIPIGNPLRHPLWHNHVFFIGDAAGLNQPLTGEGIYDALQSGVSAATSLIHEHPQEYLIDYAWLCRLIKKDAHYQQLIAHRLCYRVFHNLAARHNRFVGYFYQTQIEHACLHGFFHILYHYFKERSTMRKA